MLRPTHAVFGCAAADQDVTTWKSAKTGRGPLVGNWRETCEPVMTAYKLVSVKFKWFGLQTAVETYFHKIEKKIFTQFHRQLVCWMDRWHGMSMADIRELEERTKAELDHARHNEGKRGQTAEVD
jgi:hypothetical protein